MDQEHVREMKENLDKMAREHAFRGKEIFLFGHCGATEKLADLLMERGFSVSAILDNNQAKHGTSYRGIRICPVDVALEAGEGKSLVCIAARAYAAMADQLGRLGYKGEVRKVADYNSYGEYSLLPDVLVRRRERVERGRKVYDRISERYPGHFKILCPFSALGDICFTMSYLPCFLKQRGIGKCVVCVVGKGCKETAKMFGFCQVQALGQTDMDEMIQAALYMGAKDVFIPHQDRPYVVNLSRALYVKRIPLEKLYCCGVFGLPESTRPCKPSRLRDYPDLEKIREGKTVILSPYAKSVPALRQEIWEEIVEDFCRRGYVCLTNVAGDEKPLTGTDPISPAVCEMQSVVERAGTFIGLRSGLCDVVRGALCKKAALYPDYCYCDTRWKAIEMYRLDGWENIVIEEGYQWKDPWS